MSSMKFFKVLLSDFETKLFLPPHFCTKAREDYSTDAVVKTCLGCWKIDVGKSNGIFYFHGGRWDSFVRGHKLSVGDFIWFEHRGKFRFDATVCDTSACEKEFPPKPDETPVQHACPNPNLTTFTKRIWASGSSDHCSPRLCIPAEFWRATNLHQKEIAVLRIPGLRREWPVKVTIYRDRRGRGGSARLAFTQGWRKFCSSNKIKKGDDCIFEIVHTAPPDNVVKFDVTIVTET